MYMYPVCLSVTHALYQDLALRVMSPFIGEEIPVEDLKDLIDRSYSTFRTSHVTPVNKVGDQFFLELFHGPTYAFKDVALQFLGNLFGYILSKREGKDASLTIVGATSGDTGSAAIAGLRGKAGIECFILFPEGGVSPVQENQMTTIPDTNVHCIAVDKDFDEAQDIVKKCFNDKEFNTTHHLGAVNSINWARILAQMVYYFFSYFRVKEQVGDNVPINFSVPTGNFGDILAGYYARKAGLPMASLIVATNENDILHRFFTTGEYHRLPITKTLSPSMDICISSNFERLLYHVCGEDSKVLSGWMESVSKTNKLTLSGAMLEKAQREMYSYRADTAEVLAEINSTYKRDNYLLCPHSAVAVVGAKKVALPGVTVSLLTASPAKFPDAIKKAIGVEFVDSYESKALRSLFDLPKRKKNLPATLEAIQGEIRRVVREKEEALQGEKAATKSHGFSWEYRSDSRYGGAAFAVLGIAVAVASITLLLTARNRTERAL
jgi:threonine synthase